MLVDNNHIFQPSYFTSSSSSAPSTSSNPSTSSFPDYPTDLSDIFDTELFNSTIALGSAPSSAQSATSRGSSPQSLMTPPQDPLPTSFPDVHEHEHEEDASAGVGASSSFFSLFDDDPLKGMSMDPLSMSMALPSSSAADFMGVGAMAMDTSFGSGAPSSFDMGMMGMSMGGYGVGTGMDLASLGMGMMEQDPMHAGTGTIDPQLVDTPSAVSDHGEDDSDEKESPVPVSPVDVRHAVPVIVEPPTSTTTTTSPSTITSSASKETEKPTITIAPVKVGGHGKARKGTVQSGGVVKKSSASNKDREKENYSASAKRSSASTHTKSSSASLSTTTSFASLSSAYKASTPGPFLSGGNSLHSIAESEAGGDEDDDDKDEIPQDWRPSPEVFAKMTSKEKRQLRNKISARNFRIRRKEYIATLEGDIAERDRMLDHFRTQLGSRESENFALRQEIAALKKALLDGRGGPINLPPPAPLPETSAAEALALASASTVSTSTSNALAPSSPLLTPNTQKDLPSSPRLGANAANRFWGGVAGASGLGGGGYTPVHTTLVPDVGSVLRRGLLQENMNPALNGNGSNNANTVDRSKVNMNMNSTLSGFDGFADLNPFTMKTLDAYRMHLWGKMAQQQAHNASHPGHNGNNGYSPSSSATSSPSSSPSPQGHHSSLPSGLAGNLRPHFFSPSAKGNLGYSGSSYGSTLSALLSGKAASTSSVGSGAGAYPSPPASPQLNPKGSSSTSSSSSSAQKEREREREREAMQRREKEHQHAMLAAMASQTILGKLGQAFWDAFTGHSGSSPVGAGGAGGASSSHATLGGSSGGVVNKGDWDTDKVQRVLSGRAVLRVVDVEPLPSSSSASGAVAAKEAAGAREVGMPIKEFKETPAVKREVGLQAKREVGMHQQQQQQQTMPVPKQEEGCMKKGCMNITDILEESMRSLTLGKK
ncbi:hypothetical protein CVT26_007250 [Gymnopilus dilepis]|uniref:BZIP domain-containing protein n=1 Tax=Gymnopilus dilepis TaxID=231916 RepID=A0A409VM38_9AGAR|nr:hypothetical protein CVT26_007250 [Gymnopilus dilepis]